MALFAHLLLSVLAGFGMAVFIVEKRKDFPARIARVYLKYWLKKIHKRMPKMLGCSVCTAFWTTLVAEIFLLPVQLVRGEHVYFLWPLSGFIALGFTWVIMDFLISLGIISESLGRIADK